MRDHFIFDPDDFRSKCERHAKNLSLISLAEASAITKEYGHGYTVRTLQKERHLAGKGLSFLTSVKIGRHVYINWSMLLDFLQRKAA